VLLVLAVLLVLLAAPEFRSHVVIALLVGVGGLVVARTVLSGASLVFVEGPPLSRTDFSLTKAHLTVCDLTLLRFAEGFRTDITVFYRPSAV